jgi:hypothetical protein
VVAILGSPENAFGRFRQLPDAGLGGRTPQAFDAPQNIQGRHWPGRRKLQRLAQPRAQLAAKNDPLSPLACGHRRPHLASSATFARARFKASTTSGLRLRVRCARRSSISASAKAENRAGRRGAADCSPPLQS